MKKFLNEEEIQSLLNQNKGQQQNQAKFELKTPLSNAEQSLTMLIAFLPIKNTASLFQSLSMELKVKILKALLILHENKIEIQTSINELIKDDLLKVLGITSVSGGFALSKDKQKSLSFDCLTEVVVQIEELLSFIPQEEAFELLNQVSQESIGHKIVSGLIKQKLELTTSLIKMDNRALQLVLRKTPYPVLLRAFIGMENELKEKIIRNVSKRIGSTLLNDVNSVSTISKEEVNEANDELKKILYELKKKGEIV